MPNTRSMGNSGSGPRHIRAVSNNGVNGTSWRSMRRMQIFDRLSGQSAVVDEDSPQLALEPDAVVGPVLDDHLVAVRVSQVDLEPGDRVVAVGDRLLAYAEGTMRDSMRLRQ